MEENNVYKEVYELKKKVKEMQDDFSFILTKIYCIGGPLNDNVLGYTNKQLKPFSDIAEIARHWERESHD